jgi:hypothetical protein
MVSAVVQGDRGYLYADTAITDPQTGILLGTATKILTTKRLPCAVGVTYVGPPQATTVLKRLEVSDVQTLYARIPQAIRSFKGEALRLGYKNAVMRLLVVAWDERTGKPRRRSASVLTMTREKRHTSSAPRSTSEHTGSTTRPPTLRASTR